MEAAFFDLDKTIIAKSGPLALGRSFRREGMISRSLLAKAIYAQLMFQLMGADEGQMERCAPRPPNSRQAGRPRRSRGSSARYSRT